MQAKYLLALNTHEKIGSQTLKKALAAFGSAGKIWEAPSRKLAEKLGDKISSYIIEARQNFNPEEQIEKLQRLGIGYFTIFDKEYPPFLKELYDAPVVLYIRGDIKSLAMPSIAIVGSRKYTNYGQNVARQLSSNCSRSLAIVSGLALGIDAVVHQSCLDADGTTIGVLGCGLDQIYPVSNACLGREIIESGGAVISEFSPGTPPMKQNFPARNRIIAGLTLGTVVVEAAAQSGALITAYQALEYNREVFAVPGNINNDNSAGTNQLIKEGARVVTSYEDIIQSLNIAEKKEETRAREILPETTEEKVIYDLITEETLVDEILKKSGLNIISINTTLTMMEMKGIVENLGGGRFKRK